MGEKSSKSCFIACRLDKKSRDCKQRIVFYILEINRGYYTAARRYDFYLRVAKTIFYERAQLASE